jgi:menaquinone-specific isochorismate synthase
MGNNTVFGYFDCQNPLEVFGIGSKLRSDGVINLQIETFSHMSLDVSDCLFSYPALCDCLQDLERSISVLEAPSIVSLAFGLDETIDPLLLLRQWVAAEVCHFYFEKSGAEESVLAVGQAIELTVTGADRFEQSRDWMKAVTSRVVVRGDESVPFFGPHFYCGFSFFDQTSFEQSQDGFAAGSVFLPLWQIARVGDRGSIVVNRVLDESFNAIVTANEIWKELQKIQAFAIQDMRMPIEPEHLVLSNHASPQSFQAFTSPDQFKASVRLALKIIEACEIKKIVLAMSYQVKAARCFDVVTSLSKMRRLYQGCYIFACNNDRGETFIGASPERLVKVGAVKVGAVKLRDGLRPTVGHRLLETDALAGSEPRGETPESDLYLAQQLLNSEKDNHEHQLVIDFIIRKLIDLGLNPALQAGTLLQLPNIQHLHTPIHAVVPRSLHILDLVSVLHPTPAVAGVPTDLACEQIKQLETFDRSRYAAPIGWVDRDGNGEFAVGIRSAILLGDRARLFAGAGIVKGSNPDKELAEVQWKLQALLRAIG